MSRTCYQKLLRRIPSLLSHETFRVCQLQLSKILDKSSAVRNKLITNQHIFHIVETVVEVKEGVSLKTKEKPSIPIMKEQYIDIGHIVELF